MKRAGHAKFDLWNSRLSEATHILEIATGKSRKLESGSDQEYQLTGI